MLNKRDCIVSKQMSMRSFAFLLDCTCLLVKFPSIFNIINLMMPILLKSDPPLLFFLKDL